MTKLIMLFAALAACTTEPPPTHDAAQDQPWHCDVRATCSTSTTDVTECVSLPADGETPGGQTALRCPDGCTCTIVACSEGCEP